MNKREQFQKMVDETNSPDEFARKGCDDGLFVSMAEGRRIWHGVTRRRSAQNVIKHDRLMTQFPSALKRAGWGGLAQ